MNNKIIRIELRDYTFDGIESDGRTWVLANQACEAVGVPYSEAERLKNSAWAATRLVRAVCKDGKTHDVFAFDFASLPFWLATIHARSARPELRQKLIRFQRECSRVLGDTGLELISSANATTPPRT